MGRESNPIPVVNNIDDENYPQDFHYVTENVETSPMMVNRVISSLQVSRVSRRLGDIPLNPGTLGCVSVRKDISP